MGLTSKYSLHVLSIKRNSRIVEVSKDTMFRKGDIIIVFGLINEIKEVFVNSLNKNGTTAEIDKTNEMAQKQKALRAIPYFFPVFSEFPVFSIFIGIKFYTFNN